MGGATDFRVYKFSDRKKVEREFKEACEEARYEHGHGGYTGTIAEVHGIGRWVDRRFGSDGEAMDYASEHHNKWDPAMAVSFCLPVEKGEREKNREKKAREKVKAAEKKLTDACNKARKAFAEAKSKTVGCKGCGSKMSREHLARFLMHRVVRCPLCDHDLLPATFRERQAKLKAAVEEARKAAEEEAKPKTNGKIGWVVGGWFSS